MNKYVLIGGKTPNENNFVLENNILSLANKEKPCLLFFPDAAKDLKKASSYFIELFSSLKCEMLVSNLTKPKKELINLFTQADIIYFGGGNTKSLVDLIMKANILEELKNANKVIVGISAGANILCDFGMGDSQGYTDNGALCNYQMVKGLNLINVELCPHYQVLELVEFNDIVKDYLYSGLALENETMAIIDNNELRIIKANKQRSCYLLDKKCGYLLIPLYENKKYLLGDRDD